MQINFGIHDMPRLQKINNFFIKICDNRSNSSIILYIVSSFIMPHSGDSNGLAQSIVKEMVQKISQIEIPIMYSVSELQIRGVLRIR